MTALISELKKRKKVVLLDLKKDFSLERFKQISSDNYKDLLDRLFIIKANSYKNQIKKVRELNELLNKDKRFSLMIIDSIDYYYRRLWNSQPELAENMLINQIKNMKIISKNVPILFTNQVYTNIKTKTNYMVGGRIIMRNVKCLIELKKNNSYHTAFIKKPVFGNFNFKINEKGIDIL